MRVARPTDPLLQGFYTVPEAARLLRIGNPRRIYRWIGRDNPVLARDYEPLGGSQELSFWDGPMPDASYRPLISCCGGDGLKSKSRQWPHVSAIDRPGISMRLAN